MDELTFISERLYVVLCARLGSKQIIDIRRMVMDLTRDIDSVRYNHNNDYEDAIYSGSMAEGFRFLSSDHDVMFVRRGIRAIFSLSNYVAGNSTQTVLLAETNETKPGFALLRVISHPGTDRQFNDSLVPFESGLYLSSVLWVTSGDCANSYRTAWIHGPCLSDILGSCEVDFAECIKSDSFPSRSMNNCILLSRSGKLSPVTLNSIFENGCHFVAIGSKRPVHELMEWRISFSSAEKAIIHSFNHTQFSCYGLLKIFLKEAIDKDAASKDLLCSYFMKTAVFWMSLDESLQWTPGNLLLCFFRCLQLLMTWIDSVCCPNFFIPDNNMFADKFTSKQRFSLLEHLRSLHEEGFWCLYRCQSIRDDLNALILVPDLMPDVISRVMSKSHQECSLISEMWDGKQDSGTCRHSLALLRAIDISRYSHQYRSDCLLIWCFMILSYLTIRAAPDIARNIHETNILLYRRSRSSIQTLARFKFDATSNFLYCAIYLYRLCRYMHALRMTRKATKRLKYPRIMHPWNLNETEYAAVGGEARSLLVMMRAVVSFPVNIDKETCIPELRLEHMASEMKISYSTITIPPIVCSYFLSYLCFYRLGRFDLATLLVQKLEALLLHDAGVHIFWRDLAISWEILGICQEMSNDYEGAYRSYVNALQQRWCPFQDAAIVRILNIIQLSRENILYVR